MSIKDAEQGSYMHCFALKQKYDEVDLETNCKSSHTYNQVILALRKAQISSISFSNMYTNMHMVFIKHPYMLADISSIDYVDITGSQCMCYLPFQNLWPFRNGHGRFDTFARFRNGLAVSKRPTFPLGHFDTSPV